MKVTPIFKKIMVTKKITFSSHTEIKDYFDLGDPISICQECGVLMWYDERNQKNRNYIIPEFSLCCSLGKVQLPFLTEPPEVLKELLYDYGSKHYKNFQNNIKAYNQMFAFTSSAGKVDSSINKGHRSAPTVNKISGENIYYIGSLMPMPSNLVSCISMTQKTK
ncbi:hypothetical protein S83_005115 [Arachis hypogaea]